jgi:hypothetical protein
MEFKCCFVHTIHLIWLSLDKQTNKQNYKAGWLAGLGCLEPLNKQTAGPLYCHCIVRIGQVYDTFSSNLRGVLRSHLLLLRMVLVFLPMDPRSLRPGAPLVGPICNL